MDELKKRLNRYFSRTIESITPINCSNIRQYSDGDTPAKDLDIYCRHLIPLANYHVPELIRYPYQKDKFGNKKYISKNSYYVEFSDGCDEIINMEDVEAYERNIDIEMGMG